MPQRRRLKPALFYAHLVKLARGLAADGRRQYVAKYVKAKAGSDKMRIYRA